MGALTYIGNAPNFMVYAIAEERGIRMPSFFGYFAWAALILMPLFLLLTVLPIAPMFPRRVGITPARRASLAGAASLRAAGTWW